MTTKKTTEVDVNKTETVGKKTVPTSLNRSRGQVGTVTSSHLIQDAKKTELKMPNRLCTFDSMYADDAVYASIDYTNLLVQLALSAGEFVGDTPKGQIAADFLNYNIRNMTYGTWMETVNNMTTDLLYGFSLQNIVIEKRSYGQYKNNYCLKAISPRSQKGVQGWLWDKNQNYVEGYVQKPNKVAARSPNFSNYSAGLTELSIPKFQEAKYPIIKNNQLIRTSYNSTLNNPQGDPPLLHCFDAWYEKKLIEKLEVAGVSKDLGGVLVLRVPSELIEQAAEPETYPDAYREWTALQEDAKNLHLGKTTYIALTSDVDEVSKQPLYDIEFKGIEGGGKQYKTSEIIDQKRKSIYNSFGTGFMLLGQDGSGSYALAGTQKGSHAFYVERNIAQKVEYLNTQLAPRLLSVNNIELDWKDMPRFQAVDPDQLSVDELGKIVQRMAAVNKLTPEVLEVLLKRAGLPTDGLDKLDYLDTGASRSGDGMKTAGEGTANKVGGGDKSVSNNENGGVEKSFIRADKDTDRILDKAGNCVNESELDKDGYYK